MSDLQLSLLGLGLAGVIAVWIYNKLQERKHRRTAEKIFRGDKADVLLDKNKTAAEITAPFVAPTATVLPGVEDESGGDAHEDTSKETNERSNNEAAKSEVLSSGSYTRYGFDERREPTFGDPEEEFEPEAPTATPAATVPVSQPQQVAPRSTVPAAEHCNSNTDVVVRMEFFPPLVVADLWPAQAPIQASQRMPLRWFGQSANGEWLVLNEGNSGDYAHCQVAMQLVDRHGPVLGTELESLRDGLQAICTTFGGTMSFPRVDDLVIQAKALDEFCAQLDLQLAMHVVDAGNGVFVGTKLRGVAEAAGLKLTDTGEFYAFDDQDRHIFSLSNMVGEPFDAQTLRDLQTHGITFVLDVPHVIEGLYAFERMLAVARQFSTALGGSLVSAQRAPLSDAMLDAIRRKIGEIQDQMMLAGLPAGGACARRLFS